MKRIIAIAALTALCLGAKSQTVNTRVTENGGLGEFKTVVVSDATLPNHTIYRPKDLKTAVEKLGPLPVIVFANGGCYASTSMGDKFYNEVASHGFILIGIGKWEDHGPTMTADEMRAAQKRDNEMRAKMQADPEAAKKAMEEAKKNQQNDPTAGIPTSKPEQLTEAINWAQAANVKIGSEYFGMIDPEKIAVMGASCGGLQAISVSYDSRIKTVIMKNSGVMAGNAAMGGASFSKADLLNVKVPVLYMVGNESDVAYPNAADDYAQPTTNPVAFCSFSQCGHEGTDLEDHGGEMAKMVVDWLSFQLNADKDAKKVYFDKKTQQEKYPNWTIKTKNF